MLWFYDGSKVYAANVVMFVIVGAVFFKRVYYMSGQVKIIVKCICGSV